MHVYTCMWTRLNQIAYSGKSKSNFLCIELIHLSYMLFILETYLQIYKYIYLCIFIYTCMCVCVCVCLCLCLCLFLCLCLSVSYIYMYTYSREHIQASASPTFWALSLQSGIRVAIRRSSRLPKRSVKIFNIFSIFKRIHGKSKS